VSGPDPRSRWTDEQVELFLGTLLRFGVMTAAAVALVGGIIYLATHGGTKPDYRVFQGEPMELRTIGGVVRGATGLNGRAVIQLGLLLLIATPVARVALSLVAFIRQRDRTYTIITALVLLILLYGLIGFER
jgi:uncharacterized membrane protein